MCAPSNHTYHCLAKHRNHRWKKLAAKWASNNKPREGQVPASVPVPTATSLHCLRAKCDIWVKGRPHSILTVTSFPLVGDCCSALKSTRKSQIYCLSANARVSSVSNWFFLHYHQASSALGYYPLYEFILCIGISSPSTMWYKQLRNKELGLPAWGQEKCPWQFSNQNPHPHSANQFLNHKALLFNFSLRFQVIFFQMFPASTTEGQRMMDFSASLLPC